MVKGFQFLQADMNKWQMAILRKELVDDLVNWGAMNFHIKKYYPVVSQFPVHEMMMYAAEFWAFLANSSINFW